MTDERPHATAILAALNAELSPRVAYTRGKVPGLDNNPGTEPDIYAVLDLVRRDGSPRMRAGRTSRRSWRATVRGVGSTVDEARWALSRASTALEGVQLSVAGSFTTPLDFEGGQVVAPDKGRYSGALTWTYGT
jgi:hypothetical protein